MILPDILLVNSLNTALRAIRNDYQTQVASGHEERSVLFLLFADTETLGNYEAYKTARVLIINTDESPKHLLVRSALDQTPNQGPFVFVALAAESDRNNSTGIGVGDQDQLVYDEGGPGETYRDQFRRRWATTYQVVIGSENKGEVIVLYNFFKALLVILINHLTLEGLLNIKLGGQDLRVNVSIPDKVILRGITVNFEYEMVVPELSFKDIIRTIRLYWKAEGTTTPRGPIVITEDFSDDSSV